jgi:hypothetical protein
MILRIEWKHLRHIMETVFDVERWGLGAVKKPSVLFLGAE